MSAEKQAEDTLVLNRKLLFEIICEFKGSDMTRLEIELSDAKIRLERQASPPSSEYRTEQIPGYAAPGSHIHTDTSLRNGYEPETASVGNVETLRSPLVGTFYAAPAADAPPFVTVGSRVEKGDPICIIEAMKMMNTLPAPISGTVVRIYPANGELVEFEAPVADIKPDSSVGTAAGSAL